MKKLTLVIEESKYHLKASEVSRKYCKLEIRFTLFDESFEDLFEALGKEVRKLTLSYSQVTNIRSFIKILKSMPKLENLSIENSYSVDENDEYDVLPSLESRNN